LGFGIVLSLCDNKHRVRNINGSKRYLLANILIQKLDFDEYEIKSDDVEGDGMGELGAISYYSLFLLEALVLYSSNRGSY
jgi:hypothetical protein